MAPPSFSAAKAYFKLSIALALVAGLMLTLFGLSRLPWTQSIGWSDTNALLRFLGFLVIATIAVSLLAKKLTQNTGLAVAITAALLALVAGAIWPLLVTLWFAGASTVLGHWLLGKLKIKSEEAWLNCFLVGVGFYGTLIGFLAHYSVNYPGIYGIALALPLMLGWRMVRMFLERVKSLFTHVAKTNASEFGIHWLDVAIGVLALVYFVVALMPEVGFDALAMHLFIPAHLALRHKWGFDAGTYVWAVMPMLSDWIFSMGYLLAGETAARLINIGFIFILGGLVRNIVLWVGGSAVGARWAVLIFLSTPLTFTEGSSLYIESIWASFVVAGALAVLSSCSHSGKPKSDLPIAGLLLGCALAAKAITFTILPALLLILIWRYRSWYKAAGVQNLILGFSLFILIGCVPYATAWRLTGNPVFPMFNVIFKSSYYSTTENLNNPQYNSGVTWDTIYKITFESGKYLEASAGASGFQWLILLVPTILACVLLKRYRGVALILVAVVTIAAVFRSQSYLRYIFPSLVLLVAAMGAVLSDALSTKRFERYCWCAIAGIIVILNLLFFNAGNGFYRDFPLQTILDNSKKDKYLQTRLPIRRAVEVINKLNIERTPVAVFADPLTAGLSGDALYPSWYNVSFQKEVASIQVEKDLIHILAKRNIKFIILDSNWKGVNCCDGGLEKQALIEKITVKIAEYGSLSVLQVKTN